MTLQRIGRRDFLKLTGMSVGGLSFGIIPDVLAQSDNIESPLSPNVFITLKENGNALLTVCRSEMGQNIRTTLAQIIADEMEADWERIEVIQAPGDRQYGDQSTGGSLSIRMRYMDMRKAGASLRWLLEQAASKIWQVAPSTCRAKNHQVVNSDSSQVLDYRDLVSVAKTLPIPTDPPLKIPSAFRLIGQSIPSVDLEDMCTGKALYGFDVRIPGMTYACIKRSPLWMGRLKSYNSDRAENIKGVAAIFPVPSVDHPLSGHGGIAVVAKNSWIALKARDAIKVEWELPEKTAYPEQITSWKTKLQQPGTPDRQHGDYYAAKKLVKDPETELYRAEYQTPVRTAAMLEPPVCVADVGPSSCEIWAPVQDPQRARMMVAAFLKLDIERVTINVTLLGGGFGRKGSHDYVLEAVQISQIIQKPVKLFWSREDEFQCSFHGAPSVSHLEAVVDESGMPKAWLHRIAFPSVMTVYTRNNKPAYWETSGGMSAIPYGIESIQTEYHEVDPPTRIGSVRSVSDYFNVFSSSSFADELAARKGLDPLDFHLKLLGPDRDIKTASWLPPISIARFKTVLRKAAAMAEWKQQRPTNHGLGLAYGFCRYSYIAVIVEVKVDLNAQSLSVLNVWSAADIGRVINPDSVEAQMSGGLLFGLSNALNEEINVSPAGVVESNFHNYTVLRIYQSPQIHVATIDSDEQPVGVGEIATAPLAPALTNAIYAACGKRIRKLPIANQLWN